VNRVRDLLKVFRQSHGPGWKLGQLYQLLDAREQVLAAAGWAQEDSGPVAIPALSRPARREALHAHLLDLEAGGDWAEAGRAHALVESLLVQL
jgi:hypothetical protein